MSIDYSESRKYQAKLVSILFAIVEAIIIVLYLSQAGGKSSLDTLIKGSRGVALILLIVNIRLGFYRKIKFETDEIVIEKVFWGKAYRVISLKYTDIDYFYDFTKTSKVINRYFKFKLAKFPYSIIILLDSTGFTKGNGRFINKGKLKQLLISKGVKYLAKNERELIYD